MSVQKILLYPNPNLKKIAHSVDKIDPEISELIGDLLDTMYAGPGSVGVAAPQIGVNLRICVIDVSKNRNGKDNNHGLLVMVNPEIIARSGSGIMREGCMSVPDYTGDVERATEVTVKFMDGNQEIVEIVATDFEAVAIQHEMDHLDGILFLDRIVSLKTGLFRRKSYK
ncbi:MAG: peptide deformylase [Desulfuromonadales bacterium]|nr:peptide deformylase [Desulfuromonadales bacterium]